VADFSIAARYNNEEAVGKAMRQFLVDYPAVQRENLFITTKLWDDDHGYESAKAAIQTSLRKTGLDYVDLFLLHSPGKSVEERHASWKALEEAVDSGIVKSIGVSNFDEAQVRRISVGFTAQPTKPYVFDRCSSSSKSHGLSRLSTKSNSTRGSATRRWPQTFESMACLSSRTLLSLRARGSRTTKSLRSPGNTASFQPRS
jgi:hypothetical protein